MAPKRVFSHQLRCSICKVRKPSAGFKLHETTCVNMARCSIVQAWGMTETGEDVDMVIAGVSAQLSTCIRRLLTRTGKAYSVRGHHVSCKPDECGKMLAYGWSNSADMQYGPEGAFEELKPFVQAVLHDVLQTPAAKAHV
jgi:hypothetical protein